MELILADSESEVRLLYKMVNHKRCKWIALSPFAIVELERLSIPFDIVDNYYTTDELWDATGWNTYERVNALIRLVDDFLKERNQKLKDMDLEVLNCYKHQLIMLFDGVIGRIFMLKKLIKTISPGKIYVCRREPRPFSGFEYLFNSRDTVWGDCLSVEGWDCEVEFLQFDNSEGAKIGMFGSLMSNEFSLRSLIISNKWLLSFALYMRKHWKLGFINFFRRFLSGEKLILLASHNEWINISPLFVREGYVLDYVDFNKYTKTKENFFPAEVEVVRRLQDRQDYREKFIFEGMDFYPLLKGRIERMILEGVSNITYVREESKRYVKKKKPEAVLAYQSAMAVYWMFLQCMRKEKVPVILWSTGPGGLYNSKKFTGVQFLYIDYAFYFGPIAAETYEAFRNEYNFQPILIESTEFDELRRKEVEPGGSYILYATGSYYQHNLYFAWYPGSSDIKLYYVQKTILGYLDKLINENIIFKMHPSQTYRKPPIQLKNPRIKKVQITKTFSELILNAKVIILDCPSTTLLQAVVTNKPIFVLLKFWKFHDEALALLKKRAVCVDEPEELVCKLNCYLRTGRYGADVDNREFLKTIDTHLGDGRSAECVLRKVLEIIRKASLK